MKWVLFILTVVLVVLHQDFWHWDKVDPRLFGFLPVGLWYHAMYCVLAAMLLGAFVHFMWPAHLENVEREPGAPERDPSHGH